jgi:hypothetical protein
LIVRGDRKDVQVILKEEEEEEETPVLRQADK